ncbi:unnamed protein product [Linum tenue]|uniref:Uncharacterized protein n=1 Tax=Linum tenue TaxID=586396 RepID=A0AAV0H491_9ROSI|nr:unnamed protein product [Linum tenue]
MWKVLERLCD